MEWEPLLQEQSFFADVRNNSNYQATHPHETTSSTALDPAGTNAEEMTLEGTFFEYDVLMNGGNWGSLLFKTGVCFYREQVALLRPVFRQSSTRADKQRVVELLLESVWARHGRFLLLNDKTGAISMPSNTTAAAWVRKELQKGHNNPKLVQTPKKKKSRGAAPLRKTATNGAPADQQQKKKKKKTTPKSATKQTLKKKPTKKARPGPKGRGAPPSRNGK
mmetsp:Transcript_5586/g.11472  ORF Transcript_5586/g.11472 Transcript_5586/m.11472 type:complete len:220 (+) Transcript_5586:119-778(+)|eukprot:CAMPEP_0168750930 /NCGR_PEP_ID=MMETSP0724-20121128/17549_1 /TAXON_ID=265536 /ORGANISM="Amphiprora sp., Strain CCMP467" /LENGTH=219 /DNA_ID=CAMNT_0008799013 /DNA_START=194 /DNA_END=853 /DNA_ORIENTATION=-